MTTPAVLGSDISASTASIAAMMSPVREDRRQVKRQDPWDQKCQPDEAETVHHEQRPQRFGPWPEAEFRPDITSGDDSPRDEAECDAHEKPQL
jgi:hypothetical protein